MKIAHAADARFEKLRPAVKPSAAILGGDLRWVVEFIVEAGVDHTVALNDFRVNLVDLSPDQYLRATQREPGTDVERSLLDMSDRYYGVTIAALRAEFTHPEDFGGRLLRGAVSVMHLLSGVNGLLVARGLLPRFDGEHHTAQFPESGLTGAEGGPTSGPSDRWRTNR